MPENKKRPVASGPKPVVKSGGKILPSFVKKGKENIGGGGNNVFVKLPPNEPISITPLTGLDEMISFEHHSIWLDAGNSPQFPCSQDENCPGCMIGNQARSRGLLNVMIKTDEGMKVQVWAFGMSVMKSLAEIEEAMDNGSIAGHVIRVKKTGQGLGTKYSVVPTANSAKTMPAESEHIDLVPLVGELDRDKIVAMLEEAGQWIEEDDVKPVAKKKSRPAPPPVETEEDDDDFEDDDAVEEDEEDDDDEFA